MAVILIVDFFGVGGNNNDHLARFTRQVVMVRQA
jgi:hypothetical protein